MGVRRTSIKNAGYLLVMLPQVLFVLGVSIGFPWLSVLFFFVLLPLLRYVVGNDLAPPNPATVSPLQRAYFRALPRLYCLAWAFVLPWSAWVLGTVSMSVASYVGFALSLWTVFALTTAVAHELAHTADSPFDRRLGRLLNATVGYFHFAEEHFSHHERTGHHHGGDVAKPGVSIYRYSWNRYLGSFQSALEFEHKRLKRHGQGKGANRVLRRAIVPVLVAAMFYYLAGPLGLGIYLFEVAAAAFAVQGITYLQHWGLSERDTPDLADFGFAWEDGCWMQACVTLNNAYHGQHHVYVRRPYYQLTISKGALVLPASYPVMFLAALYPSFFTRIMQCRLTLWLENKEAREAMMHRADCLGVAALARRAAGHS